MKRHPTTAILITCPTCGLVRMAHDYAAAQARGKAHINLSGHPKVEYSQIVAPERYQGRPGRGEGLNGEHGGSGRRQRHSMEAVWNRISLYEVTARFDSP